MRCNVKRRFEEFLTYLGRIVDGNGRIDTKMTENDEEKISCWRLWEVMGE